METITRSKIQDLIAQLPTPQLPLAYQLLVELANASATEMPAATDFMRLPLAERRRIMAQQAQQLVMHYEQTHAERHEWQAGDFIDEH